MHEPMIALSKADHLLNAYLFPFAWKILGAFAVWIAGGFFIRATQKILQAALKRKHVDSTLTTYANSAAGLALKLLLVIAILGIFGIETTSFSAILAAAGVAIGMAWSGLLSNFAAGIFLILFRPFKVGDTIAAAGVSGTVREIGMFATTVDSNDNLRLFVSNNKIFSDNILNYSSNPYRIATFKVQLSSEVNPTEATAKLVESLSKIQGIESTPRVVGDIAEFNPTGTLVSLRVACHQSQYSNVVALGNQAIYETLKKANYPAPENKMFLVNKI